MNFDTGLAFLIFFPFVMGLISFLAGTYSVRKREAAGVKEGQENLRDALSIGAAVLEFLCTIVICGVTL